MIDLQAAAGRIVARWLVADGEQHRDVKIPRKGRGNRKSYGLQQRDRALAFLVGQELRAGEPLMESYRRVAETTGIGPATYIPGEKGQKGEAIHESGEDLVRRAWRQFGEVAVPFEPPMLTDDEALRCEAISVRAALQAACDRLRKGGR